MATFSLGKHPHVELCDLLKLEGWSESGAQAISDYLGANGKGLMLNVKSTVRLKRANAAKSSPVRQ